MNNQNLQQGEKSSQHHQTRPTCQISEKDEEQQQPPQQDRSVVLSQEVIRPENGEIAIDGQPARDPDPESAKMLIFLENGEERLIKFTLPKNYCSLAELLRQMNVPVSEDTFVQCMHNNGGDIDYFVSLGSTTRIEKRLKNHPLFNDDMDNRKTSNGKHEASAPEISQVNRRAETSEAPSVPPPPKYVKLAVCKSCGCFNLNFNSCQGCGSNDVARVVQSQVSAVPHGNRPAMRAIQPTVPAIQPAESVTQHAITPEVPAVLHATQPAAHAIQPNITVIHPAAPVVQHAILPGVPPVPHLNQPAGPVTQHAIQPDMPAMPHAIQPLPPVLQHAIQPEMPAIQPIPPVTLHLHAIQWGDPAFNPMPLCRICINNKQDHVFVPCGHTICGSCAYILFDYAIDLNRSMTCHLCRNVVENLLRLNFDCNGYRPRMV